MKSDLPHLVNQTNIYADKEGDRRSKTNKLENLKIELDLDNRRKIIHGKINQKKNEKNSLINQIRSIEKNIDEINLDLEFISIYGREGEAEGKPQENTSIMDSYKKDKKKSIFKKNSSDEKKKIVNLFRVRITIFFSFLSYFLNNFNF